MATNSVIIDAIAQAVSDPTFQRRTQETFASILTEAQDYLVEKLEILEKVDSTSITLVADTDIYSLPTDFIKLPAIYQDIKDGDVSIGTNGIFPISRTSIQLLNHLEPGWRDADSGSPEFCYLIRQGTRKIGFHPKPSSTFISSNGSAVYFNSIYRPTAIAYDSNKPFDDSFALQGLQYMLKMRAYWQLYIEDKMFAEADRMEAKIEKEIEKFLDQAGGEVVTAGEHGFVDDFGGDI